MQPSNDKHSILVAYLILFINHRISIELQVISKNTMKLTWHYALYYLYTIFVFVHHVICFDSPWSKQVEEMKHGLCNTSYHQ